MSIIFHVWLGKDAEGMGYSCSSAGSVHFT